MATESRLRSAIKALTWRAMAALVTLCLVFAAGGSTEVAVGVASLDSLIKIILYYVHERAWCAADGTSTRTSAAGAGVAVTRAAVAETGMAAAHAVSVESRAA